MGGNWLTGDGMTIADIVVFTALIPAFQLALDAGFRKLTPALDKWFEKLSKLPVVTGRIGFVKPLGGRCTQVPTSSASETGKSKSSKDKKAEKDSRKAKKAEKKVAEEDND